MRPQLHNLHAPDHSEQVSQREIDLAILFNPDRWIFDIPVEAALDPEHVRLRNCLLNNNFKTLGDFRYFTPAEIHKNIRNFGEQQLDLLQAFIAEKKIVTYEHLIDGTAVDILQHSAEYWQDKQPDVKNAYIQQTLQNDFIKNKTDAVKDAQGGCVIETLDPNDPVQLAYFKKLQESGLVEVKYQVVLSKGPKQL